MSARRIPTLPATSLAELVLPAGVARERWLVERRNSLGASDMAAVLGASRYRAAFEVFADKSPTWSGTEFVGNLATEWGSRLESAVIAKAADQLGMVARTGGQLWRSPAAPYLHATPDAFATRRRSWRAVGVLEAKTAGDADGWQDGSAPLEYLVQVQTQLHVLGLPVGWLACLELTPARNFYLVEVRYDRAWAEEIAEAAVKFWTGHVLPDQPPMHDLTHPRTAELLKEAHPRAVVESIELPDEAEEWIEEFHAAKAQSDAAGRRLDEIKNWLRLHLGDAGAGYLHGRKVISYSEITTSRVDVTKLRESFPETAASCVVTSTSRRLTVNRTP